MHLSGRLPAAEPNELARARAQLTAQGVALTDLTDTNPTRHGLLDPRVASVMAEAAAQATAYDPDPRGPRPARDALAERFGGDPDDYWLTASTSEAYGWLFDLLADPSDRVAIMTPGYPLIEPLASLAGVGVTGYHSFYLHPSGWELDLDSARQTLANPGVRAVVAVNPNNPTGAYLDAADALAHLCAERGLPLIADEVFWPYRLDADVRPPRLAGRDDVTTFALDGLSKLLCAPQLKLGWIRLSGPDRQIGAARLDAIADTYLSVGAPVGLALPRLLNLADESVARVRARLLANLAALRAAFADGGYRVRTAQGGWMALLDVPPILDDDTLALRLLRRARLWAHPGWFYDLDGGTTLALSLLPEPDVFAARCAQLRAAVDALA